MARVCGLGEYLANEIASHIDLSEIDCVMPIPDSSRPAAQQLAQKLNIRTAKGSSRTATSAAPSSCRGRPPAKRAYVRS